MKYTNSIPLYPDIRTEIHYAEPKGSEITYHNMILETIVRKKGDDGKYYLCLFRRTYNRGLTRNTLLDEKESLTILQKFNAEIYRYLIGGFIDTEGKIKLMNGEDLFTLDNETLEENDRLKIIYGY